MEALRVGPLRRCSSASCLPAFRFDESSSFDSRRPCGSRQDAHWRVRSPLSASLSLPLRFSMNERTQTSSHERRTDVKRTCAKRVRPLSDEACRVSRCGSACGSACGSIVCNANAVPCRFPRRGTPRIRAVQRTMSRQCDDSQKTSPRILMRSGLRGDVCAEHALPASVRSTMRAVIARTDDGSFA
jgi:hypothetical protein